MTMLLAPVPKKPAEEDAAPASDAPAETPANPPGGGPEAPAERPRGPCRAGQGRRRAAHCLDRTRGLLQYRARMPKMKTHSGAKKRFKTGTGKLQGPPRHDQPHPREEERQAQAPARPSGRDREGRRGARQEAARANGPRQALSPRAKKRRATLERTKGYRGQAHSSYKRAKEALLKADTYAYRDRRNKKRDFRRLWIQRINAAARQRGHDLRQFMHGLKLAGIELDRKVLADIAVRDPETFRRFAEHAREAAAA